MKFRGGYQRWLCICLLLYYGCAPQDTRGKITVATAANMQFAMEALTASFTKTTGIPCELVVGSSGKLTAQIIEGAPYDLFIAANMTYPERVHQGGKAKERPRVYAQGRLVLWSMKKSPLSMKVLTDSTVTYIALANPRTAPYGHASIEVMQHYNVLDSVAHKLVYGESISQTNQFILSGAATLGFTSLSTVLSTEMKGRGEWVPIPPDLHSPISQGMVLLNNNSERAEQAKAFYDYLLSAEAGRILESHGYFINE